jgi:hypothetical protein
MPAVVEGAAGVMVAPSLSNGAGGVQEVLRELQDERRFPGMQPVGVYPIHIVVRNGRTSLKRDTCESDRPTLHHVRAP